MADIRDIGFGNHYASDADELKLRLLQDWNKMKDDKKHAKKSAIKQKAEQRVKSTKFKEHFKIQNSEVRGQMMKAKEQIKI